MTSIRLRAVSVDDADWIFRACQDPDIQHWTTVPRPYTLDDALFFTGDTTLEYRRWAIEDAETSEPLGLVSIHGVQEDTGDADIGYWVAPWGRGRSVGSAAVREMIDIVRTEEDIAALVAYVAAENSASQSVVRRAGFVDVARQHGPARRDLELVPTIVFRRRLHH
ncbi:MAG: GNAT family N-acetyltransferase [Ilumatobacteraceae bacterium]